MKKIMGLILSVALSVGMLSGCSGDSGGQASSSASTQGQETESSKPVVSFDGKVVLGATAPLTGPNQLTGGYYVNGMKMAVDEINAAGGILGKELILDVQDEGTDQSIAINATIKLIESGVPAIIGSYFSTNCMAVLPEIEKNKVLYFANGSNPDISAANNEYVWQIRVTDDFTGPIMADIALNELNMKNPAVLYTTASSTTIQKDNFIIAMNEKGNAVAEKNVYGAPENESNFSSIINQILNSGVDGLVVMGVSEAWDVALAQQLQSAGCDIPLMGSSSFASAPFIEVAREAANGWYTIADWSPNILEDNLDVPDQAVTFEQRYEELFDGMSAMQSAWGYDCVCLFKEACERAGTTEDREKINQAMKDTDMQGANNYYRNYEDTFHVLSTYILLCETTDGAAVPVRKVNFR
ncbi:ABC transporter substrate-binding protein [Lachnospiraceae bacterium 54-53]